MSPCLPCLSLTPLRLLSLNLLPQRLYPWVDANASIVFQYADASCIFGSDAKKGQVRTITGMGQLELVLRLNFARVKVSIGRS